MHVKAKIILFTSEGSRKIISFNNPASHETLSRWKRRFGNRAEADLSPEEMEAGDPEVVEETAALGRPEHYLLNNKIFPGSKSEEVKDKVNSERVVKLFLDVVCKL